jgi:hypothetical protein
MENWAEDLKSWKPSEKSMDKKEKLKEESEQKMGRCPLCSTFHYFIPKRELS